MSPETWAAIDPLILQRRGVEAIKSIQDEQGCALSDALVLYDERWQQLKRERPDDFMTKIEG